MTTTVAEYIFSFLADHGIQDVFLVTGGGAIFLDDALRRQDGIQTVSCHHEQAAAMAAEGHARISGLPGVVCVTAGPGGINALNGVFGAWTDSIPMIVVSGQVKREMISGSYPGLGHAAAGRPRDRHRHSRWRHHQIRRSDRPTREGQVLPRARLV